MKGLVAVLLGFALAGCGSSSGGGGDPQALCKQGTQKVCDLIFDCAEAAPVRSIFGTDKANCVATQNADQCTSTTGCAAGETYHADQAQACFNGINAVTCAQLGAGDPSVLVPAACDSVCTTP